MNSRTQLLGRLFFIATFALAALSGGAAQVPTGSPELDRLLSQADAQGSVRVIVSVDAPFVPEPFLDGPQAVADQRTAIGRAQDDVLSRVSGVSGGDVRRMTTVPMIAIDVDRAGLAAIAAAPGVRAVWPDTLDRATLAQSSVLVGASTAWANGATGAGWTVAILDTGVDKAHPFLEGKVVSEACFSTTSAAVQASSVCPGGASQSTAAGSGVPCAHADCFHGTHVAGIAAGSGSSFSGVGRGASLMALQVFSQISNPAICGNSGSCIASFVSDQIAALERVYALRGSQRIAAVNMSLGGELFTGTCDGDARKPIIDTLRAAGILTVVSSGNNSSSTRLTAPACISSALSVGSVGDGSSGQRVDVVSSFSNSSSALDLLAPGATITSSRPGGTFTAFNGTSMAAPHVAGAIALLRQQSAGLTADQVEARLTSTGLPITDARNSLVRPRLRVDAALAAGCSFEVSPLTIALPYVATARQIGIVAPVGCRWTATTAAPWLSITAGASGAGSGTVSLSSTQNTLTQERTATVAVAGQTVTVRQAASPCTFSISPTTANIGASGGVLSLGISATTADCVWTASTSSSFFSLSATQGTGSGALLVTVAANALSAARQGTVVVAGQTVTINQSGVACSFSVNPSTLSLSSGAATRTVTVTGSASDCSWSVSSPVAWVAVTRASNPTTATVSVQANPSSLPRSTTVTVAGQAVGVNQAGVSCTYAFSPSAPSISASGGTLPVTVTPNAADCSWTPTTSATWLSVSNAVRVGTAVVPISVQANERVTPRSATLGVGSQRVTITQAGVPCSFTLTASATEFGSAGGAGVLTVAPSIADCGWTVASSAPWLTVTGSASGSGPGAVNYAVAANILSSQRTAQLSVGTTSATIVQTGVTCQVELSSDEQPGPAAGGSVAFGVKANASDCSWSVTSSDPWITPASVAGVGTSNATFTIPPNPLSTDRLGAVNLGSQIARVRQAGVVCTYTTEPAGLSYGPSGGSAALKVVANASDCSWSMPQGPTWLTSSAPIGTGTQVLQVTAAPHVLSARRTGTLVVAGLEVPVEQAGVVCTVALAATSADVDAAGATVAVQAQVNAPDCGVASTPAVPWIAVSSSSGSELLRTVSLVVERHTLSASRVGTVTVGGVPFAVNQRGVPCTYQLSANSLSISAAGGVARVLIAAAAADCRWSVTGLSVWAVAGATSGSGSQGLDFSVTANPDEVPRAAAFNVAGSTLIINQGSRNVGASQDGDNDTLPDVWEIRFGLSAASGAGGEGPNGDPDGDGLSNLEEYLRSGHPRGFSTRYLAEGASSGFFSTRLAVANPTSSPANVLLRFIRNDSVPTVHYLLVPPRERRTVVASDIQGLQTAEFSTVAESDVGIVIDRLMTWDARGYGSHLEGAVRSPASTWYLAEGATTDPFELFYLLENPTSVASRVRVQFVLATGDVVERFYDVSAGTRLTVWVDRADARLASAEVAAIIDVVSGAPIIVERAMYLSRPDAFFAAGHESAGAQAPGTQWFLAEGATGPYFDTFILLLNPTGSAANVQVQYLLGGGAPVVKTYTIGPRRRTTIWVDTEDARLSDTGFGAIVQSTNGVPIVVERSMWWPSGNWQETHGAKASQITSQRWALAEGESGGTFGAQTFVLISNTSPTTAVMDVTVLFEDRAAITRTMSLGPASRYALHVPSMFPEAAGRRFSTLVESSGAQPAQLVVEQAIYTTPIGGPTWGAGAAAGATPLP